MPFADPVIDAGQPCLEICEDEMDNGQKLVGHFGITAFGNGVVNVTALAQVGVTAPVVRDDQRPRSDRAIDKSAKGLGASVSGDGTVTLRCREREASATQECRPLRPRSAT